MDARPGNLEEDAPPPRETCLAELARALHSPGHGGGVEAALAEAARETGADAIRVLALLPDGEPFAEHAWAREGCPGRTGLPWRERGPTELAWARAELAADRPLHVPSLASLPAAARQERVALADAEARSYLALPIRLPGLGFACLECTRLREERAFGRGEIARLRLIAEIFASALRHRRVEHERDCMRRDLERQLRLELAIVELSRDFLSAAGADIDSGIRAGLHTTAGLVGAERAWLYSLDTLRGEFIGRYEWCAEGIRSYVDRYARPRDSAGTAWFRRRLLAGEVVVLNRLDELPEEAAVARAEMERRGVRSQLGVPLFAEGDFIGFLGLETFRTEMRWPESTIPALRLLGELFAGTLRRKRAEEDLRESQRLLAHSQRMEAMGQLAGGIAHDFNNLLVVISGCGENAAELLEDGSPARAEVDEIRTAGERAATLTRQLLAFGRRQPVDTQVVDPNAVVREIVPMLRRLIGEDVDLGFEAGPAPHVRADRQQLEQMLVNLAVNARDAMPSGGRLAIETASCELGESAALALAVAPGRYAEIRVSDNGLGMDEHVRARVFEPYFTTKGIGRGTGLGLAIVYGIVRQGEGAIRVESAPEKGTTFHVYLPACSEGVAPQTAHGDSASERGHETVLLVEDEASVRRLLRRTLEGSGYRVIEAGDGVEALERVVEHRGSIDLVLTDMVMPKMGGSELARRLIASDPSLRVLLMSGYLDDRVAQPTKGLHGARLLEKPFDMAALRAAVRHALDEERDDTDGHERGSG